MGQSPIQFGQGASDPSDTYKGRSLLLPALLVLFAILYVILYIGSQMNQMFWFTIACYLVLAGLLFLRRPYLTVGKDFLRTRRFGGDRTVYQDNIKSITAQKGYVIVGQNKGGNWVFSKLINRYPTEAMTERLRTFAAVHRIPFEEK